MLKHPGSQPNRNGSWAESGSKYRYDAIGPRQIRLLRLLPDDNDKPLAAHIATYTLDAETPETNVNVLVTQSSFGNVHSPRLPGSQGCEVAPAYISLSYYWGTDKPTQTLRLSTRGSTDAPFVFQIRPNLANALRRIRQDIQHREPVYLWTDAICIDQDNVQERNAQIQKMADIFQQAEQVYIWLGAEKHNSSDGIKFAKKLPDIETLEKAINNADGLEKELVAFYKLMNREWFGRRWVVQEITLAKKATVYCGEDKIDWEVLEEAISMFAARRHEIRKQVQGSKAQGNPTNFSGEIDAMGAVHLVELTNNIAHRAENDRSVTEHRFSLEGLMSSLTMFHTSEPCDMVYALLWLAHDARPGSALSDPRAQHSTPNSITELSQSDRYSNASRLDPDMKPSLDSTMSGTVLVTSPSTYEANARLSVPSAKKQRVGRTRSPSTSKILQTFEQDYLQKNPDSVDCGEPPVRVLKVNYQSSLFEVYADFLIHVFARSKSLDIICLPWALLPSTSQSSTRSRETLPSWMPSLTKGRIYNYNPHRQAYKRLRADPLVGKPGAQPRIYSACGQTKAQGDHAQISFADRTLTVRGFELGIVSVLEQPAEGGTIPVEWLERLEIVDDTDAMPRYDTYGTATKSSNWCWQFFVADRGLGAFQHAPTHYRSAFNWLIKNRAPGDGIDTNDVHAANFASIVNEYLERARAVVWGRRLAILSGRFCEKLLYSLVPKHTQLGDIVCIFYGCSVPVVLRPRKDGVGDLHGSSGSEGLTRSPQVQEPTPENSGGSTTTELLPQDADKRRPTPGRLNTNPEFSSPERYELVGDAYVHSMMYGEGFAHRAAYLAHDREPMMRNYVLV